MRFKGTRTLHAHIAAFMFPGPIAVGPTRNLEHTINKRIFRQVFGFLPKKGETISFNIHSVLTPASAKKIRARKVAKKGSAR